MKRTILFIGSTILILCCSSPVKKNDALGEVAFNVTGSEAANDLFIKGHLLMHSFEYDDAAELFRLAQQEDTSCVMAFWGEAMTYNHPIWQQQDYEKGKAALEKLGVSHQARIDKTSSQLEKDFLKAADILYGNGTKTDRDSAYAEYMGSLYEKYPGNHEVAALYALSLLGSIPVGRNDDIYQQSAKISEGILKENPNHPGALHYLIHADDDPLHAGEALEAANEYALVAPDASHALHMPTHIFVALGMWDKVIELNVQSWRSSQERKARKNLTNDDLGYHSFFWLEYGYLQKGRYEDARSLLDDMIKYCDELPSSRSRSHEVAMRTTYFVETNDWNSMSLSDTTNVNDMGVYIRARQLFIHGVKYYHNGDAEGLAQTISQINRMRQIEAATLNSDGIAVCKSGALSASGTTQLDIDQVHVMEAELEGLRAWKNNDLENAERWFKKALAVEEKTSYSFGPPAIVKPSAELYGEFLLAMNRAGDAMKAFDASLQRAPKRRLSLKGKIEAARMLKLENEVSKMEKELSGV
jgi:tetratricopeptide (TPR) repeat protein